MCRAINLQCSCGCKIAVKNPIKRCQDGASLQFSCKKLNPDIVYSMKKPYECPRCCSKAIELAQSKFSAASGVFEAARAKRYGKGMRVAKSAMDRANKEFSGEPSKHAACEATRHRDEN